MLSHVYADNNFFPNVSMSYGRWKVLQYIGNNPVEIK